MQRAMPKQADKATDPRLAKRQARLNKARAKEMAQNQKSAKAKKKRSPKTTKAATTVDREAQATKRMVEKRETKKSKQFQEKNLKARKRRLNRKSKYTRSEYDTMGGKASESVIDRMAAEPDFWEKIAEDDLYDMLREMGNSEIAIQKWQKNRLFQPLLIGTVLIMVGFYMDQNLIMGLGALIIPLMYKMKYNSIKGMYNQWKFERNMAFSRFVRLLIPYLKQADGKVSLYTVFNKMLERMENEADQDSLYMLMGEMSNKPGDIRPFLDFAERQSGSNEAFMIMSSVYDFQQFTQDTSVVDELGRIASAQMMKGIDEIIAAKNKRFVMFPTKMVMMSMIFIGGSVGAFAVYNIAKVSAEAGGSIFGGF